MPKLTGAHLFVRCLKMEGIEKVFTIVGDTILPLVAQQKTKASSLSTLGMRVRPCIWPTDTHG